MPRSIWKGSIGFGLVNIPVELFSAVRDHRPRFRLLHAKDEAPVRYERVCQTEGKPVGWEELVKGYEYEKGQFVVLTKDDFKTAALQKTKTVDILDFVDPTEIDDRYFETPYYMTPGKGAARSYALLREAIRDSEKMGIGKIILRETQHLAAIEVIGDALVLTMMRFSDELADLGEFSFPSAEGLRKPELTMARQLVDNLSASWEPGKYTDEYVKNLMRIIDAKLKGRKPKLEARKTQATGGRGRSDDSAQGKPRSSSEGRNPEAHAGVEAQRARPALGPSGSRKPGSTWHRPRFRHRRRSRSSPVPLSPPEPLALNRSALADWYVRNRKRSRELFDLLDPQVYYSRPISLRNPIVFYEGHLPAFSLIALRRARRRRTWRGRTARASLCPRNRSGQ